MKTLIFNNKEMNFKSREQPLVWGEGKELEKQGRWEVGGMMSGSGMDIDMRGCKVTSWGTGWHSDSGGDGWAEEGKEFQKPEGVKCDRL